MWEAIELLPPLPIIIILLKSSTNFFRSFNKNIITKIILLAFMTYIFAKMSVLGRFGNHFILDNPENEGYEQDHSQATTCKRRKPKDSEIKSQDFSCMTAKQLYNKIRCLQDPYPNPYIECADGTKLFIKEAYYE